MSNSQYESEFFENPSQVHWGHFGLVLAVAILLLGATWFKDPKLFTFNKLSPNAFTNSDAPRYYAYVQPAEDNVPLVAGASTNEGPMVISDDGSNNVIPVDRGEVLGASTKDVKLSLEDIKIDKIIPDSEGAIKNYIAETQSLESNLVENNDFEQALSSQNQQLINDQADKLNEAVKKLNNVNVPQSFVKLHKLKIVQYESAVKVLQNFTQADNNPQLVGEKLQEFLKSEQDLQIEKNVLVSKFNIDPVLLGGIQNME